MKILPSDSYTIYTDRPEQEVRDLLDKNISYEKHAFFRKANVDDTFFTGFIVDDNFEFKRCVQRREYFLPKIYGAVRPASNGCLIEINIEFDGMSKIIISSWLAFTTVIAVIATFCQITQPPQETSGFIFWIMPAIGLGMTLISFNYENSVSKKFLLKLVDGQIA